MKIIMELFERVKHISKKLATSETKLAASLGLPQRTFNNYLNKKSQHNLWELLPRILEFFPQIRRDWLYFNEGEMLRASDAEMVSIQPTAYDDQRPPPGTTATILSGLAEKARGLEKEQISQYLAGIERENALLREMLADKDRIIALQDEKLQRCEKFPAATDL
jgi:hypothetical protein